MQLCTALLLDTGNTTREVYKPLVKIEKRFSDIATLARRAGYSTRHFRRIIAIDNIPVIRISRKFFVLTSDFDKWKLMRSEDNTAARAEVDRMGAIPSLGVEAS